MWFYNWFPSTNTHKHNDLSNIKLLHPFRENPLKKFSIKGKEKPWWCDPKYKHKLFSLDGISFGNFKLHSLIIPGLLFISSERIGNCQRHSLFFIFIKTSQMHSVNQVGCTQVAMGIKVTCMFDWCIPFYIEFYFRWWMIHFVTFFTTIFKWNVLVNSKWCCLFSNRVIN